MALSRTFLSAATAVGDGAEIYGGFRNAGHAAARHHPRAGGRKAEINRAEVIHVAKPSPVLSRFPAPRRCTWCTVRSATLFGGAGKPQRWPAWHRLHLVD